MLKCQKNKLWVENISNLLCSYTLIPMTGMTLAEQMNSLSRLVIFIFMILLTTGFQSSLLFFTSFSSIYNYSLLHTKESNGKI
jgi:hypothetical protein